MSECARINYTVTGVKSCTNQCRVRKEKEAGTKVVDVDGSYLHRKKQRTETVDLDHAASTPSIPLRGWELIEKTTCLDGLPVVTHGTLYRYVHVCSALTNGSAVCIYRSIVHIPC